MIAAALPSSSSPRSLWRDVVQPKEHGSWSLALEPVALGLIAAPSLPGSALGIAVVAGFLMRRPAKIAWIDRSAERRARARAALAIGATIGLGAFVASGALTDPRLAAALLPAAIGSALFLTFDLRNDGREGPAELCGAFAFASLPAAFVVAAGGSWAAAGLLAFAMIVRAGPTVLAVRAWVRGAKQGRIPRAAIVAPAAIAFLAVVGLARSGALPVALVAATGALLLRAAIYAALPADALRARTIGLVELVLGAAYVAVAGAACRF